VRGRLHTRLPIAHRLPRRTRNDTKCREMVRQGRVKIRSAEWRKKIGDSQRGPKNHACRDGKHLDKNGYVWVLAEDDPLAAAMASPGEAMSKSTG
jgi:hypothetical protein